MWHLKDEEMVSYVSGDLAGDRRKACASHLRSCSDCRSAVEDVTLAVQLLASQPMRSAPPFAWSKIKARIEGSMTRRDWAEPAWTPLVLGNVAGIALIILTISAAGGWLENASIWRSVGAWPLAKEVGPRSLVALVFFGAAALVTLALTPIFWWESRHPRKRVVK